MKRTDTPLVRSISSSTRPNAGLPLIGDRTYHPKYRSREEDVAPVDFPRQALHAEVLTLEHPEQPGTRMSWTAALPRDLRQLEAALRSGARTAESARLSSPHQNNR